LQVRGVLGVGIIYAILDPAGGESDLFLKGFFPERLALELTIHPLHAIANHAKPKLQHLGAAAKQGRVGTDTLGDPLVNWVV
jgi:hypothetical protein